MVSDTNNPLILCLMGPTASGKTAIACELAQRFPLEIISIDSAMIYRGFNVGAAKPDLTILAKAPHHLIDILDPPEVYSAAQCCEDVKNLCDSISSRGNTPLLVGGTMMYFNALQKGLSSLPQADKMVRQEIIHKAYKHGWDYMHSLLATVDAASAARIHPNDTQRIQRALEVFQLTQTPLSQLWEEDRSTPSFRFINLAILPEDRSWLHARITDRFKQMLAEGLIDEVEQLVKKWSLTTETSSMRSVGYRQVLSYLHGEYDKQILFEKGIAATRQLAKRQLTWLRHWQDKTEFIAENPAIEHEIVASVRKILDNNESSDLS